MNLVECGGILYEVPSNEPDEDFDDDFDDMEDLDPNGIDWESPFGDGFDFSDREF
jgi:hypothetical protein